MKPYTFLFGSWALTLAAFRPVFDAATATSTNAGGANTAVMAAVCALCLLMAATFAVFLCWRK